MHIKFRQKVRFTSTNGQTDIYFTRKRGHKRDWAKPVQIRAKSHDPQQQEGCTQLSNKIKIKKPLTLTPASDIT